MEMKRTIWTTFPESFNNGRFEGEQTNFYGNVLAAGT